MNEYAEVTDANLASTPHTRTARPAHTARADVDRSRGARFVSPLNSREYLALSEAAVRTWPFGGWVLLDDRDRVIGFHWHEMYPVLGLEWTSAPTAFAAFIPDDAQRAGLATAGWTVQHDTDNALLAPYLCSAPAPWRH